MIGEKEERRLNKCISGKRSFENEAIAVEGLIQHHVINDYPAGQGPINVYQCEHCGMWHFTSKGPKNAVFDEPEIADRIKKERRANYWERKLK